MVGISFVLLGGFADFVALSFAPQCVIAALGSTTLIANVFFSKCLLKEKSTRLDLMATFAVVIGAFLATFAADRSDKKYTLEQLIVLASGSRFLIYMAFVVALVTTLFLCLLYAFMTTTEEDRKASKFIPFVYAAVAGIFGAQSVLMAKMAGELIVEAISSTGGSSNSPFENPHSYVIIAIMLTTILLQTHFLNLGLRKFDALVIFPIFQVFWIVFGVVGGIIFFKEVSNFHSTKALVFVCAILMILIGVYFLAKHEMEQVFLPPNKFKHAVLAVMCANKLRKIKDTALPEPDEEVDIESGTPTTVLPVTPSERGISFAWSFLGPETAILSADVTARNSSVLRNSRVLSSPPVSPIARSSSLFRGPITRSRARAMAALNSAPNSPPQCAPKVERVCKTPTGKDEIEVVPLSSDDEEQQPTSFSAPPSREPSVHRFKLTLQNSL